MSVKQAVILAGGRGERLKPFTDEHPKPMYPVQGVPFIDRLVSQVKGFGIEKVLLLLGYKAEQIMEELGDGERFGLHIDYDVTPPEYDTGDRLYHAKDMLDEKFILMYCDNYCPIDFDRLVKDASENDALIQLSVYSNKDGYTKNNLRLCKDSEKVEVYDKSRKEKDLAGVDIGYAVIDRCIVDALSMPAGNFAAAVYAKTCNEGRMYATVTDHRYYSIGSFERMHLTEEFFSGKKAAFLDRDGTLNERPPRACYVEKPEDFKWLPGAIEAVKMLNDRGIITVLISNQPGIARGNMTEADLEAVNAKMQRELEAAGAHMDHIYFCPHNWDEGCECRKPKPGMLYMAQRDLSLNLSDCVLFGDDDRDIAAADAARVEYHLVSEEYPLINAVKDWLAK